MDVFRRNFLKFSGAGVVGAVSSAVPAIGARAEVAPAPDSTDSNGIFDVRNYGARGDGKTNDSPAINEDCDVVNPVLGSSGGKGLSRGTSEKTKPRAETPGTGNKAIALKNCYSVILRDISILEGGHFGILATGVDNLTIDNLKIDTNRDGMDIDCCRNVRVSNCSVNSP